MRKLLLGMIALSIGMKAYSADIWGTIPFVRGADLCAYEQAFSQTRTEYMKDMVGLAKDLMDSGAYGSEALEMLEAFDGLYDKHISIATQNKYIDVTLENTLKGYLDQYYRSIPVLDRKIQFKQFNSRRDIVNATINNQRSGNTHHSGFNKIDYIAYGSYSYAPNCKGNILVTINLVGKDGYTKSYQANNSPSVVMSDIASRMFEDFQRTQFPKVLDLGFKSITLLGATNRSVSKANIQQAQRACKNLGGRLPSSQELEDISAFGDWNGGVSIGNSVWAINGYGGSAMVYHPRLSNPSPVRNPHEVNEKVFNYYCVK